MDVSHFRQLLFIREKVEKLSSRLYPQSFSALFTENPVSRSYDGKELAVV